MLQKKELSINMHQLNESFFIDKEKNHTSSQPPKKHFYRSFFQNINEKKRININNSGLHNETTCDVKNFSKSK